MFSWNGTAWREDEFSRFRRGIGTNVPLTPRLHYVGLEWQTSLEVFGYQPPKSSERVTRLDYMATTAPGGIVQLFAERGFLDVEIARIKKLDDWSLAAQGPRLISIQGSNVDFWEPSGGTALVGAPVKDIRFCNDDKWLIVKTDVDLTVWDAWSSQRVTELERTDLKSNKIWMSDSFISAAGESVAVITAELLADGDMQDNEIRICRSEIGTDVKASNRLVWCHDSTRMNGRSNGVMRTGWLPGKRKQAYGQPSQENWLMKRLRKMCLVSAQTVLVERWYLRKESLSNIFQPRITQSDFQALPVKFDS